jgi:hypothetical protein
MCHPVGPIQSNRLSETEDKVLYSVSKQYYITVYISIRIFDEDKDRRFLSWHEGDPPSFPSQSLSRPGLSVPDVVHAAPTVRRRNSDGEGFLSEFGVYAARGRVTLHPDRLKAEL